MPPKWERFDLRKTQTSTLKSALAHHKGASKYAKATPKARAFSGHAASAISNELRVRGRKKSQSTLRFKHSMPKKATRARKGK